MFPIPLTFGLLLLAVLLALWLTPKLSGWGKRAVESSIKRFKDDLDGTPDTPKDEVKLATQLSVLIAKADSLRTQVGTKKELVAVEKEIAELLQQRNKTQ